MLGERSDRRGLWEADRLYLDHVGRESFYGVLTSLRGRLFRDAKFYCPDNGRDSVPPSLLATALLLQSQDKVSDAEAQARADFDLRWKAALGIEVEDRPFAKSTLQVFRAQLILHDKVREVFESSLRLARESGYLQRARYEGGVGPDQHPGAWRGEGHLQPADRRESSNWLRALAQLKGINVGQWAKSQGYHRYLGSSIKGEAAIDWSGSAKHGRRCCLGLWPTRTGCWNYRGRRRGNWERKAPSGSGWWPRRNCWGCCCSRTWSALMTEWASE